MIKKGPTIGANATIICGHSVGRYAFIAAGAEVTQDVPDFALVMGVPAKVAGYMCQCGHRLPMSVSDLNSDLAISCEYCGEKFVSRNQVLISNGK